MNEQQVRHIVREVLKEYISAGGLDRIEDYADSMFNPIGVDIEFSRHFLDRLNDPRNIIDIESYEMKDLFKKLYNKYGQKIPNLKKGQGIEAVVTDMNSNINIPFEITWDKKNKKFDMNGITVMRKKNFKGYPGNMKMKV